MSTGVSGLRPREVQKFGWVPDLPDARDFMYSAPEAVLTKLPKKVDLRSKMPKIYDQGELGSCTANAIGAAFEYEQIKEGRRTSCPRASSSTTTSGPWKARSTPTAAR